MAIVTLVGCTSHNTTTTGIGDNKSEATTPNVPNTLAFRPATAEECPAGGEVYFVYQDFNGNGTEDDGEPALSRQIVCNGSNGLDGVFSMLRVQTSACPSGTGVQLNYGLDANANAALDASEITQTEFLCDGVGGADGHGVAFSLLSADASACPAGGTLVLMAEDVNDDGVYSALSPHQESMTLCNGMDGADQPMPAYAPVEPIIPCGNTVAYKEVLLLLANGQVLSSFSQDSSGTMTRLAFLPDGSYMDTDASGCAFSLTTASETHTRSISWLGQVQMAWSVF
jgi:hypothetical protein